MLRTSTNLVTVGLEPVIQSTNNNDRKALLIQWKSGGTISVKFGQSISVQQTGITDGIDVAPGGSLLLDINCPTEQIWMVGSTVNTVALIVETLAGVPSI